VDDDRNVTVVSDVDDPYVQLVAEERRREPIAVRALLEEPAYRTSAQQLQADLLVLPPIEHMYRLVKPDPSF
jgi:hypothetical protein